MCWAWESEVSGTSECESFSESSVDTDVSENLNKLINSNISLEIAAWLVDHRITEAAGNSLLKLLRKYNPALPVSVKTLKKTPTEQITEVVPMGDGFYSHVGLRQYLENFVKVHYFINIKMHLFNLTIFL